MPPRAGTVLPEDPSSLAATEHCSFSLPPCLEGWRFPDAYMSLMQGRAWCCVMWLRRPGAYLAARFPCRLGISAHMLGSEDPSWSKLAHTKMSCSEVSLEPGSSQIHRQDLNSPLAAMGFQSKYHRSNLSQIRVVSLTSHVWVLQVNAQLAYFTDCHKHCF